MGHCTLHVGRCTLHEGRWVTEMLPKVPKRRPKGAKEIQNGAKGCQKGAKGGQMGAKIDPKIDKKTFTLHLGEKGAEKVPKSCQNIEIAGPILDHKSIKK